MKAKLTLKTLTVVALIGGTLWLGGCSKEKNTQPTTTNNNSPYYVSGLLDGERINISGPSNPFVDTTTIFVDSSGHICGAPSQGQDSNHIFRYTQYTSSAIWTLNGSPFSANSTIVGSITFKKLSVRVYVAPLPAPAATTLYNLLTPTVSFADDDNPTNGVIVSVRDSQGVLWTSLGEQHGSSFQINSVGQNMGTYAIITGSVTANMYDGMGHKKQLTSTAFNAMVGL